MFKTSKIWIVTDIDGTLMDHSYDYSPAKDAINWLQELKIPIIPCTSKTASEVKIIRNELNLRDPYIVENGGAIHGEKLDGSSWELILGLSYQKLSIILDLISNEINYKLIPLNNLSDNEATKLTGLKGHSLTLMRDRHWSMPFLNPPANIEDKLTEICKLYDVEIFRGNRMSHMLSINSNKGKAIDKLKSISERDDVKIIGLGDSPNDLPLLLHSDYRIVIISAEGPNKKLTNNLKNVDFIISKDPHGYGWNKEIKNLVEKLIKT